MGVSEVDIRLRGESQGRWMVVNNSELSHAQTSVGRMLACCPPMRWWCFDGAVQSWRFGEGILRFRSAQRVVRGVGSLLQANGDSRMSFFWREVKPQRDGGSWAGFGCCDSRRKSATLSMLKARSSVHRASENASPEKVPRFQPTLLQPAASHPSNLPAFHHSTTPSLHYSNEFVSPLLTSYHHHLHHILASIPLMRDLPRVITSIRGQPAPRMAATSSVLPPALNQRQAAYGRKCFLLLAPEHPRFQPVCLQGRLSASSR